MNPLFLLTFWSFKKDIWIVSLAFIFVLFLPVFAVFLLTTVGLDVVSDRLAKVNPTNNSIEIKNPADGKVIKEIKPEVVWPTTGVITLEFGESDLPYQLLHTGIDIANPQGKIGDPVTAFMKGKVTYAGEIFWGFGKHIVIDHGDNITSVYGHLDKIFVYPGQEVDIHKVIGLEGSTGWSTGPHVHFQTNVFGIPVNPRIFLGNGNP